MLGKSKIVNIGSGKLEDSNRAVKNSWKWVSKFNWDGS